MNVSHDIMLRLTETGKKLSEHQTFISFYDVSDLTTISVLEDMDKIYTPAELQLLPVYIKQARSLNHRAYNLCMQIDEAIEKLKANDTTLTESKISKLITKAENIITQIQEATAIHRPFIDKLPIEFKANLD